MICFCIVNLGSFLTETTIVIDNKFNWSKNEKNKYWITTE